MADSEAQQTVESAQQPVDSTQQVTSKVPILRQKNPKRVAAGEAIAEKTRLAREAQKKQVAEANMIIATNQLKRVKAVDVADPPAAEPTTSEPPTSVTPPAKTVLTTTQWLSVISIFISVVGIYYKHEEIKKVLTKKVLTKNPPQAPRHHL